MKRIRFFIVGVFQLFLFVNGFSQSTLTIATNAGYNPPYNFSTGYTIDSVMGEVSGCYYNNGLFIFVIDTPTLASPTCDPWATNFAGANPDHDFGNLMGCRARPEYYFQYHQSDPNHMQSLDSLINLWIPNGYVFGMYSWIGYDYPTIAASSPALGNTLVNYWGSAATSSHTAAIFYGVKGYPATYEMIYTDNSPDTIQMVKQICQPLFPSGIATDPEGSLKIFPNPFSETIVINGVNEKTNVQMYNALGIPVKNINVNGEDAAISTEDLPAGIYFMRVGTTILKLIKN